MADVKISGLMIPTGLFVLISSQLLVENLTAVFRLPVTGSVIGMLILAVALTMSWRNVVAAVTADDRSLERTGNALIRSMGLLFVPAGVGVVAVDPVGRRRPAMDRSGPVGDFWPPRIGTRACMCRPGAKEFDPWFSAPKTI